MVERLHLDIVTPSKKVLSTECDDVYVPGSLGEFGILLEHAALLSTLIPGLVRVREGVNVTPIAVRGGFVQVVNNRIALLADEAITKSEVNRTALEEETVQLEAKLLDSNVSTDDRKPLYELRDWIRAQLQL